MSKLSEREWIVLRALWHTGGTELGALSKDERNKLRQLLDDMEV